MTARGATARSKRSFGRLLLAVLLGLVALAAAIPASAAIPTLPGVVAGLQRDPVYVDPAVTEPTIDAARLKSVLPQDTYFAALPRSVLTAGGDPAAVPALLSNKLGRGSTFVVLIDGQLYGASTITPGQLGADLATAQNALPATGDATPVLIALMRSLAGPGTVSDPTSPPRAGGPVGGTVLIVLLVLAVIGGLVLWWKLRGPARRRRRRAAPARDLVEVDYSGRIVRRVPAAERSDWPTGQGAAEQQGAAQQEAERPAADQADAGSG